MMKHHVCYTSVITAYSALPTFIRNEFPFCILPPSYYFGNSCPPLFFWSSCRSSHTGKYIVFTNMKRLKMAPTDGLEPPYGIHYRLHDINSVAAYQLAYMGMFSTFTSDLLTDVTQWRDFEPTY